MAKKLTTKQFIERANKIHNNLYDYSKVKYKNTKTKVCIIDPVFGEFYQTPGDHLNGCGCPDRKRGGKLTAEIFAERANTIHNNLYNYSKVKYKGMHIKVCIIDPDYGEFYQVPYSHLAGNGSPNRAKNKQFTTDKFIEKAKGIHANLYDYSKVNYKNAHIKICIIDPDYGEFYQRPYDHLNGKGCLDRSHNGKDSIHKDHIIPLTILGPRRKINKNRPLYKFLNSSINMQEVSGDKNNRKSDWINVDGGQIRARNVRNNYTIIKHLTESLLNVKIDEVIKKDRQFYIINQKVI